MDRIFDTYVEAGCKPMVQIGFMPEALSTDAGALPAQLDARRPVPRRSPPAGHRRRRTTRSGASSSRPGRATSPTATARTSVESWPWEVWNEPDGHYWRGTIAEFCEMYDVSARAVKRALPDGARRRAAHLRRASAAAKAAHFLRAFLQSMSSTPARRLDFLAFHAKGNPVVYDGHVRMGLHKQLRDIEAQPRDHQRVPDARAHLPIVIGESDPEGCAACSARDASAERLSQRPALRRLCRREHAAHLRAVAPRRHRRSRAR